MARILIAPGVFALGIVAFVAFIFSFSGLTASQAVQNPTISLDMDPAGNSYSDPGTGGNNSMTVGTVDTSSSGCPGNYLTHIHTVHLVIRNIEDLDGWEARFNYDGGKMRPNTVNFRPFMDSNTGQLLSFLTLPIDSNGIHRDTTVAATIPPAAPGPQTAVMGSSYVGAQAFAVSPDTPAKSPPDDASYDAPTGGVLAALNLQVLAGNQGQTLTMDLDDDNPNTPGSGVSVFNGSGSVDVHLSESALGDGSHAEGVGCPSTTPTATPPAETPTPTATPSSTDTPTPLRALRMSLDMNPSGNSYSDPGAGGDNSMSIATIDQCVATPAPGDNGTHIHPAQLIVQNVRDLIGWQARVNYDGGKMRPASVNFTPFMDTATGQNISFLNLPIDSALGVHRDQNTASNIPPPAPGPQTAGFGSAYVGSRDFPISPDSPPKSPADDSSYRALFGGVLATVNLQVMAGNAGQQSMFMNLDDDSPNATGSGVLVFDGTGSQEVYMQSSSLGDGYHGEGTSCVPLDCINQECPEPVSVVGHNFTNNTGQTATDLHVTFSGPVADAQVLRSPAGCPVPPTVIFASSNVDVRWDFACVDNGESVILGITSVPPATPQSFYWTIFGTPINTPLLTPTGSPTVTPTPNPTPTSTATAAGHDSRVRRIGGVRKSVGLSPGQISTDSGSIVVQNESPHTDRIGVYVDVTAPPGCDPNGRFMQTTVTLAAGAKTTISVPVNYECFDPNAAKGQRLTWVAVADHSADDLASCPPGSLLSVACFDALADDDQDPADNRATRNGPKVIAQ